MRALAPRENTEVGMWVRATMWDQSIELGEFDHWVLTGRPPWKLKHWLDRGLVQVPPERVWPSIRAALAHVQDHEVPVLWKCLFEYRSWHPSSVRELEEELTRAARGSIPEIIVLERLIERGFRFEPVVWRERPLPLRTQTEHFIVISAVDAEERPVQGLRLELLIADGEIKSTQTGRDGIARVERIHAGQVVIRVLGIDGALWRPADGPGHVASSSDDRPRLHTVIQGESLSTIAHGYGIKDWHAVWIDAKNETLRKRRKNPNVLLPGDEVMVPAVALHEITRPTDQTHRLIVDAHAEVELDLVLEGAPTEPLAGHSCVLRYDGPQGRVTLTDLKIDDQGRLRVTLPILVKVVELEVKEIGETIALHLGALDPAADADTGDPEISGVQQRLWALGYAGAPTGRADEATRAALASFQARELGREDPTGELDAATSAKLEEYYGV